MPDDEPKIKVFASDDNLKALGELLSNDSSRNIIYHLMTSEMYTNELATKLDMRVSLVIHHLKKMEDLELLIITNKKIKRKGQEHRFFKIDSDIFVTVDKTKEELKEKGFLKRIFRDGIKFVVIGLAAIISFFTYDISETEVKWSGVYGNHDVVDGISLEIPLLVIIIGLVIERIYSYIKNKKRG